MFGEIEWNKSVKQMGKDYVQRSINARSSVTSAAKQQCIKIKLELKQMQKYKKHMKDRQDWWIHTVDDQWVKYFGWS